MDPLPFYIISTNSCQPSIKEVFSERPYVPELLNSEYISLGARAISLRVCINLCTTCDSMGVNQMLFQETDFDFNSFVKPFACIHVKVTDRHLH